MEKTLMPLEEWKSGVATSSHVRKGDTVHFTDCLRDSGSHGVSAGILGTSVFLGYYFIADREPNFVGKGWWHE